MPQLHQSRENLAPHLLIGITERMQQRRHRRWISHTSQRLGRLQAYSLYRIVEGLYQGRGGRPTPHNPQNMRRRPPQSWPPIMDSC